MRPLKGHSLGVKTNQIDPVLNHFNPLLDQSDLPLLSPPARRATFLLGKMSSSRVSTIFHTQCLACNKKLPGTQGDKAKQSKTKTKKPNSYIRFRY